MTDGAHIALRPRNIGARLKRVEDRRLLMGQGMFTDDRAVPGALHVAFLRSNHAHALISRIDVETALAKWGRYSIAAANEVGRVDLVVTVCVNLNRPIAPVPQTRINVPLGSKGGDGADEFCEANDTLKVYAGDVAIGGPSGTPLWIYSAKDSLRHPDVPAVDVLRRAIEHAEREEQTRQQKKQQKRQKQNPQQGNPQNQP